MSEVFKISDVKKKKASTTAVAYKDLKWNKEGEPTPLKTLDNLKCLLDHFGIKPTIDKITHEMDLNIEDKAFKKRGSMLTHIYNLQIKHGLNLQRSVCDEFLMDIANDHEVNPFITMCKENRTEDHTIILDVFESCLEIQDEWKGEALYFFILFEKWLLNVVKLAHNELDLRYTSNGVLTLQGEQGIRKSTFCKKLLPAELNHLFKDGSSLQPDSTDNVIQNTRYLLVELAELDNTLKADQGKLKQFLTNSSDEYRVPYGRVSEMYPRVTSYIANVNKADFLKDETGSRRFWVIPVKSCNIENFDNFDMKKFWGAVYDKYMKGKYLDYLTKAEEEKQKEINRNFNAKTDISITLDDKVDWEYDDLEVYTTSEICDMLHIREKKALDNEMMKRGIPKKVYKVNGKSKRGYKIPRISGYFD